MAVAKKPSRPKKPVEPPPPPDPLKNAWRYDGQSVELGDGTIASEMLVSAMRLLGLRDSLDSDTFLRHLFYVNDLGRKEEFGEATWVEAVAHRLNSKGLLKRDRVPRRGDLIWFSMDPAAAGRPDAHLMLAGVVDQVGRGRATFIAPMGGHVARGSVTLTPPRKGAKPTGDTALLKCTANPPDTQPKKGHKKGQQKPPTGKPRPCRAGELLIGSADIEAVQHAFH